MAELRATIERVAFGGEGIARTPEGVLFIPNTLPGETVRVRLVEKTATYGRAELVAVETPSPDRFPPQCPLAGGTLDPTGRNLRGACPGCVYAHVRPETETALKQTQLIEMLERVGRLSDEARSRVLPPIPAVRPYRYRNKAVFHVSRSGWECRAGYYGFDNETVLDVPDCLLTAEPIAEQWNKLRSRSEWPHTLREGMTITLRWTRRDGVVWWRNRADPRQSWLSEEVAGEVLRVPADAFFQVNPWMLEPLADEVGSLVREAGPEAVLDLYSGVGLFSVVAFRSGVRRGWGVEVESRAVEAATWNARQLGMEGFCFTASSVERAIRSAYARFPPETTMAIVDPPRAGLSESVRSALLRYGLRDILYISCACDTLARDLATLTSGGQYLFQRARLLDFFPRTAHFETVVWLRRKDA